MNKKYTFTHFFILFIALNLIDALTTSSILLLGGIELNFLPSLVIESYGILGFFLFKAFASIILAFLCISRKEIWDFLLILFATICCWNSIVLIILANNLSTCY